MNALFVIESPFQLLSAYEALNSYKMSKYKIIVRLSGKKHNDYQLKNIQKLLFKNDTNINYITINTNKRAFKDYKNLIILILIFLVNRYNYLFIGNLESKILSKLIIFTKKSNIFLLDDGIKSIIFQNSFNEKKFYNLYTMINSIKAKNKQVIVYNNFNCIKKNLGEYNYKDCVCFIGSKISECGIVSEENYIEYIAKIFSYYKNESFIYIAHREESITKLDIIKNKLNMNVVNMDYPIELFSVEFNYIPKEFVSFYSAALISLKKIYNIKTTSYFLTNISSKYKNNIVMVYSKLLYKYTTVKDIKTNKILTIKNIQEIAGI